MNIDDKWLKKAVIIESIVGALFLLVLWLFTSNNAYTNTVEHSVINTTENSAVVFISGNNNTYKHVASDFEIKKLRKERKLVEYITKRSNNKVSEKEAIEIIGAVYECEDEYRVSAEIILAMIANESDFIRTAKSRLGPKYGRGLMQVSEVALKSYNSWYGTNYGTDALYDIHTNILIGTHHFTQGRHWARNTVYSKYLDDKDLIIIYNCGVGKWRKERKSLRNGWIFDNKTEKWKNYNHLQKVLNTVDLLKNITN